MKFELSSVSERYPKCKRNGYDEKDATPCTCHILEINTLEELLEYVKKEGEGVIISSTIFADDHQKDVEWSLATYDDYME